MSKIQKVQVSVFGRKGEFRPSQVRNEMRSLSRSSTFYGDSDTTAKVLFLPGRGKTVIAKVMGVNKTHTKEAVRNIRGGLEDYMGLQLKRSGTSGKRSGASRKGGGDDQPRVPAGNPDGGQWTKG